MVRVSPRAAANAVGDFDAAGRLVLRVTAPPVEGAANDAVVELLARQLRVAKSRVHVARGATSRTKIIDIDGLDAAQAAERLTGKDSR